ncbi:MAG: SDR family oxidoreductase [Legionella sp.]|nr:SDR family oxidoreductase [Legionella sp.]
MNHKVALITGASQGIGKDIAIKLAAKGMHVIIIARNIENLEAVSLEIKKNNGVCTLFQCDITKYEQIKKLFKKLIIENLIPTIIINNAGFGGAFVSLENMSLKEWDCVFNTNIKSMFYILKVAIPYLKKLNFGKIVNIASAYGVIGGEKSAAYSASKHAVIGLTKSLALELADYNIQCNSILPGFIQSEMSEKEEHIESVSKIPTKKMGKPSDISELILFLTDVNSSYIHGSSILIDGGLTAGMRFN